jgi:hypothetical protein
MRPSLAAVVNFSGHVPLERVNDILCSMVAVAVGRDVIGIVDAVSGLLHSSPLVLDVMQSRNTLCMVINAEDYVRLNHFFVDDGTNNSSTVRRSPIHRPERRPSTSQPTAEGSPLLVVTHQASTQSGDFQ